MATLAIILDCDPAPAGVDLSELVTPPDDALVSTPIDRAQPIELAVDAIGQFA